MRLHILAVGRLKDAAARDACNDYATRIGNISGENPLASRLNGDFFLKRGGDDATVFDDEAVDFLFGGFDRDWFFFDPFDLFPGKKNNERGN